MAQYRLTANKTKLYNLAKVFYPGIESRKNTDFFKHVRSRSWALEFWDGDVFHRLTFGLFGGQPMLCDRYFDHVDSEQWNCRSLTLDVLRTYGLLEGVPV